MKNEQDKILKQIQIFVLESLLKETESDDLVFNIMSKFKISIVEAQYQVDLAINRLERKGEWNTS